MSEKSDTFPADYRAVTGHDFAPRPPAEPARETALREALEAMTYAEGAPSDLSAESLFASEGFDWCKERVLRLLAAPLPSPQPLDVLRHCVDALDIISEMSDATEQSAFREEAWAALEHVTDDLRARLSTEPSAES